MTITATGQTSDHRNSFLDYVSIARPDHWVKHVFIIPGIALAALLAPTYEPNIVYNIFIGLLSACFAASANYVINEWLDAEFDRHHPLKHSRAAASGRLKAKYVYFEYTLLVASSLLLATLVSTLFLITTAVFITSGVVYNVRPMRTKERPHLDIITESFNNPIRILLGWSMISSNTVPPISLLLIFWFGGAFLMATKRFSEYRLIERESGTEALAMYRRSFRGYSEATLLVASFFYAMLSAFALGIFLLKYRNEYILSVPLMAGLFAYYLYLALGDRHAVQAPETLYREKGLFLLVFLLVAVLGITTAWDLPWLESLIQSSFTTIEVNLGQ